MARTVPNKKGFLIIAMTLQEAIEKCKFGFYEPIYGVHLLVDDNTNECLNKYSYIYYVAVLNKVFSKANVKHWLLSAERYEEDIPYEQRYFNYYKQILNL